MPPLRAQPTDAAAAVPQRKPSDSASSTANDAAGGQPQPIVATKVVTQKQPPLKVGALLAMGFTPALARIVCAHGVTLDSLEDYAPRDVLGAAGTLVPCFGPATPLVVASAVDALLLGHAGSKPRPTPPTMVTLPVSRPWSVPVAGGTAVALTPSTAAGGSG